MALSKGSYAQPGPVKDAAPTPAKGPAARETKTK